MIDRKQSTLFSKLKMDLAAFIMSIAALLIAIFMLPTMFFLRWAKPNIEAEYHSQEEHGISRLYLVLRNLPVENKFQKWLGVVRGKATTRGRFIIKDMNGAYLDTGAQFLCLNHSEPEVVIGLEEYQWAVLSAVHNRQGEAFFCAGQEEHSESVRFKKGRYLYQVELSATGGDKVFSREFTFYNDTLRWDL